jgi:hypothetical protein
MYITLLNVGMRDEMSIKGEEKVYPINSNKRRE